VGAKQHEVHKLAVSAKASPAKKAALKKLAAKGKLASPNYSEHRGRSKTAAGGIPPIPPPPHIMGALPGQGGPLGGPGGGFGGPPNPVQEGLQEIMGGWTGAGWWQPCSEVSIRRKQQRAWHAPQGTSDDGKAPAKSMQATSRPQRSEKTYTDDSARLRSARLAAHA